MKINYIPLAKAKELLTEASKERELDEVQTAALKHVSKFSKVSADKAAKLQKELESLGLDEMLAVKVIDIMPTTLDELRSILYPHVQNLEQDLGNKVIEIIQKSR